MNEVIEQYHIKHYYLLVKRIKYRTGNEADAEDIVQEAFSRALKYQTTFHDDMEFRHWFGRILSNVLKDYIHDKFVNGVDAEFDEEHEDLIIDKRHIADIMNGIGDDIDNMEDPHHREVVTLYLVLGFPIRDIVKITNMKYKSIDTIVHRFKKRMEERYG